jgi:hypothetical protein
MPTSTFSEAEVRAVLKTLSKESRRLCGVMSSGVDKISSAMRACVSAGTHEITNSANRQLRYHLARTPLGQTVNDLILKEQSMASRVLALHTLIDTHAEELERYGFRLEGDGRFFHIEKNKQMGVWVSVKRGRTYYNDETGRFLYASGVTPIEFVARFWYATAKPSEGT